MARAPDLRCVALVLDRAFEMGAHGVVRVERAVGSADQESGLAPELEHHSRVGLHLGRLSGDDTLGRRLGTLRRYQITPHRVDDGDDR